MVYFQICLYCLWANLIDLTDLSHASITNTANFLTELKSNPNLIGQKQSTPTL